MFESRTIQEGLGRQGVEWKFIPCRAPWYGGYWERLIGLTKNVLKKALGRAYVTLPSLQTIVVEIEAHLNNRPLTYVSSDLDEPEPLTPSHLLYGRIIDTVPHSLAAEDEVIDENYQEVGSKLHNTQQESKGPGTNNPTFLESMEKGIPDISQRNSHCQ